MYTYTVFYNFTSFARSTKEQMVVLVVSCYVHLKDRSLRAPEGKYVPWGECLPQG
jgi:hypothetical protein